MRINKISKYDVKLYFRQNKISYILFAVALIIGLIIGLIISFTNDSYLNLLSSENKILYSIINGTANSADVFFDKFFVLIVPIILIFLTGLNYYLSLLSFIFIAYQSALLMLTSMAVVFTYGIKGFLNVIFIIVPLNLLYFIVLIFFSSVCLSRSKKANKLKSFSYGLKEEFFIFSSVACILMVIFICFVGTIILPLFLRNAIFIIF